MLNVRDCPKGLQRPSCGIIKNIAESWRSDELWEMLRLNKLRIIACEGSETTDLKQSFRNGIRSIRTGKLYNRGIHTSQGIDRRYHGMEGRNSTPASAQGEKIKVAKQIVTE